MKLEITNDHIKRGVPGLTEKCPIALALTEQGYKGIQVGNWAVYGPGKHEGEREKLFLLSKRAVEFVKFFDNGMKAVGPTVLELLDPTEEA